MVWDAGSGSLGSSEGTYAGFTNLSVVRLDRSIELLTATKSRVIKRCSEKTENVVFLQGDILPLRFRPGSFRSMIAISVLHVLDDQDLMIDELMKINLDQGKLSITSLVLGRILGEKSLGLWQNSGGAATPRTVEQVLALFPGRGIPTEHYARGNMISVHPR